MCGLAASLGWTTTLLLTAEHQTFAKNHCFAAWVLSIQHQSGSALSNWGELNNLQGFPLEGCYMDTLRKETLANDHLFPSLHPGMFNHLECPCCTYRFKSHTRDFRHTVVQKGMMSSRKGCVSPGLISSHTGHRLSSLALVSVLFTLGSQNPWEALLTWLCLGNIALTFQPMTLLMLTLLDQWSLVLSTPLIYQACPP